MIQGAVFNVLDYGADLTGATNSQAACQAAINACRAAGGGTVYFPEGQYLLTGVASSDSTLNGLLVPYVSANGTTGRIILQGDGRSTVLLANSNNMYVVRFSDSHGGVRDMSINANTKTGVIGLGCVPESTVQTASLVYQIFNIFSGLYIIGCDEGVTYRCGPDVAGEDSGCWYNLLENTHIYFCKRGIWLQDGPNAGCSPCNRNNFISIRVGSSTNTGVQIDAGDTCKFYAMSFEGINTGTSPNAIPTGVKIAQAGALSGADNNANAFMGCSFEACTRDLDNFNIRSQFFACLLSGAKVNTSGGANYGLYCLGGDDSSQTPQIGMGALYQTNNQVPGYDNGLTFITATGKAQVETSGKFASTVSFQEKSGTSGNLATGATFVVTIPSPRRPQLLFLYSGYDLQQCGMYLICGDGALNVVVSTIVASTGATIAGTASNQVTITNAFGGTSNFLFTLTPFGVAVAP
tara:strand:- start:898 stop:2292 length:1395 start_codon:yes stop_codon:yes gene_type:complete